MLLSSIISIVNTPRSPGYSPSLARLQCAILKEKPHTDGRRAEIVDHGKCVVHPGAEHLAVANGTTTIVGNYRKRTASAYLSAVLTCPRRAKSFRQQGGAVDGQSDVRVPGPVPLLPR